MFSGTVPAPEVIGTVPSTLFTDPELAHVGLTEKEAVAGGFEIQVLKVPVTPLTVPRAKTTGQMDGL